ncbi:MAG: hypothetical protein RIF41_02455, partial [Polyangiaceae bacterium]
PRIAPTMPTSIATTAVLPELVTADLAELRRFVRQLRRARNRLIWRQRMQRRTSATSAALHAATKALGEVFAERERVGRRWVLFAHDRGRRVEAIHLELRPVRRNRDFLESPVELSIKRPDLVDVRGLEQWATKFLVEEKEDV